MALFNSSKSSGVPTDLVLQMRYDGLSNNQVIQNLQRQGFDSNQIFDAMSQADMKMQGTQQFKDLAPNQQQIAPPQVAPSPMSFPDMAADSNHIEEVVEAMLDEKWGVFEESVKKILAWKTEVEVKLGKAEESMKHLSEQLNTLQTGIYGKIGEYDKHIQHIGTELKAVDKVFSKVLPALAENVSELSTIAHTMKKKS